MILLWWSDLVHEEIEAADRDRREKTDRILARAGLREDETGAIVPATAELGQSGQGVQINPANDGIMTAVSQFLSRSTTPDPRGEVNIGVLYAAYRASLSPGESGIARAAFERALADLAKLREGLSTEGTVLRGVRLA